MSRGSAALWSTSWVRLRRYVLARDAYRCQIAGPKCKRYATEVDHIVARSEGGAVLDPANLRAACKPCNSGRGNEARNWKRRHSTYRVSVPDYEVRL